MIDIETIKDEIVERLKPLDPDKIILFGSYANGTADEDSDIDLFVIKDNDQADSRSYELEVRKRLRELIYKYKIGFDVLSASKEFLEKRQDYFYEIDILSRGKIVYAK